MQLKDVQKHNHNHIMFFICYEYVYVMNVYQCMHARTEQHKTCRDCITLNSSVCVYWNETKLCAWVARGKILTVTECFSEFNSHMYNACNDVIDGQKMKLASLQF